MTSEVNGEEAIITKFFQTMSSGNVLGELYWQLNLRGNIKTLGNTTRKDLGKTAYKIDRNFCGRTGLL